MGLTVLKWTVSKRKTKTWRDKKHLFLACHSLKSCFFQNWSTGRKKGEFSIFVEWNKGNNRGSGIFIEESFFMHAWCIYLHETRGAHFLRSNKFKKALAVRRNWRNPLGCSLSANRMETSWCQKPEGIFFGATENWAPFAHIIMKSNRRKRSRSSRSPLNWDADRRMVWIC